VEPTQNNTFMTKKQALTKETFSLNNPLPIKADTDTITLLKK
jgi:hypothetical protein